MSFPRTINVAPGSTNNQRRTKLRLCAMEFTAGPPLPESAGEGPPPRLADELMNGFTLRVLEKAYVILVPLGDETRSFQQAKPIAARTTEDGELIGADPAEPWREPLDPKKALFFSPGEILHLLWSRSAAVFKKAWEDLQADPKAALRDHPFSVVTVEAGRLAERMPTPTLSDKNRAKLPLLLYGKGGIYDGEVVHGTFTGDQLKQFGAEGKVAGSATYAIARSDALAAVYVADFVYRRAIEERLATSKEWAVFDATREVVRNAVSAGKDARFEEQLLTMEWGGTRGNANAAQPEYRTYAYRCAQKGVDRATFAKAIRLNPSHFDWDKAAVEIWQKYRIPHPARRESGWDPDRWPNVDGVQRYFDFYEFGFKNERTWWNGHSRNVQILLEMRLKGIRSQLAALLDTHAATDRVFMEAGAHHLGEHKGRAEVLFFAIEVKENVGQAWWNTLMPEADRWWQRMAPYVEPIGTSADKLGEILGTLLSIERAQRYNALLGESVEAFETMFQKLTDFDRRFEGKTVSREYGEGTRLEVDFESGSFVVTPKGGGPQKIGGVAFVVEVDEITKQADVAIPPRKGSGMRRRFRRVTKTTKVGRPTVTNVPFKKIHRWPQWLGALGDGIALGFMIFELTDRVGKQDKIEVGGTIAQNTFQMIGSLGNAVEVSCSFAKKVSGVLKVASRVGRVGNVIEAYFNFKEGMVLIFDDFGEAAQAARQDNTLEAATLWVKGWVLMAPAPTAAGAGVVAGSAALLAGKGLAGALAAGGTVAAATLSIGLAVAGLIVVGIDVGLLVVNGPDSTMQEAEETLAKAIEAEFGEDRLKSRTEDSLEALARSVAIAIGASA